MQVISEDKDKRSNDRRAHAVDLISCIRNISRYIERECVGRFGSRRERI